MTSLRLRLLLLAGIVMTVALLAAGFAITQLFALHLERRVGQELETHLELLAGGLRIGPDGTLTLVREPIDPRFSRVFGGLYWQIIDTTTGATLRSRSLWDASLSLAADAVAPGEVHVHAGTAPDGAPLLLHERLIAVPAAGGDHPIRLAVAIDRAAIDELRAGFARDMVPALGLLGLVLFAGFGFQVFAGLRPLRALGRALGEVRRGETERIEWVGPQEVAPLVEEVNSLLARQAMEIVRARDRAADLAHGLKTPLTAMASDIRRLRDKGQNDVADDLDAIAGQMQRHVDRELARSRIRHGAYVRPVAVGEVAAAVVRSLVRTPDGARVAIELDIADGTAAAMDIADLTELIGNLLENACRHAAARVRLAADSDRGLVRFRVDDDGPGLPEDELAAVIRRGTRLDTASNGAGLGLAIVSDIVAAYGGEIALGRSALGGVQVEMAIPGPAGDRQKRTT